MAWEIVFTPSRYGVSTYLVVRTGMLLLCQGFTANKLSRHAHLHKLTPFSPGSERILLELQVVSSPKRVLDDVHDPASHRTFEGGA